MGVGVAVLAIGGAYWYADYRGWFNNYGPDNLPTAEERARMQEIERTSATVAPNAKAGVGVVPRGSTPPPPPAPELTASSTEEDTSSEATTTEEGAL